MLGEKSRPEGADDGGKQDADEPYVLAEDDTQPARTACGPAEEHGQNDGVVDVGQRNSAIPGPTSPKLTSWSVSDVAVEPSVTVAN